MTSYRLEFPDERTYHDAFVELARFLPGLSDRDAIERRYRKHYLESPPGRPRAAAIYGRLQQALIRDAETSGA